MAVISPVANRYGSMLVFLTALVLQQPEPRIVECPREVRTYVPVVERAFQLEVEAVRPFERADGTFALPDGWIALERWRCEVHVFGPDGAWLHDLEKRPGVEYQPVRNLAVAPDGSWLRNRQRHSGTFDDLSPRGEHLATRELGSSRIGFVGEDGAHWVIGDEELALVGADDARLFETRSRPDGAPARPSCGPSVSGSCSARPGTALAPSACSTSRAGR